MKRKKKPIKITYAYIEDDTNDFRLERVFDALFNETDKKGYFNKIKSKKNIRR